MTESKGVFASSIAVPKPSSILEMPERREGSPQRLIFVTNRGPIEHTFGPGGQPTSSRGAGGVVSGLLGAAQERPVSWISLAMTDADRAVATHRPGGLQGPAGLETLSSHLVAVPEDMYGRYYDGFSNRILWFVLHGMDPLRKPAESTIRDTWERGYVPANQAVANTVVAELRREGTQTPVMFHDYHVMLAPALVRREIPDARLQHFIHTPWPEPFAWHGVPRDIVRALFRGLAANDVIGMQTPRDVRRFLMGIETYCPEMRVDHARQSISWVGREIAVRAYPIALTPHVVVALSRAPQARAEADDLLAAIPQDHDHQVIMRVDRVEPTKNILRGFSAYERLLREHPELRGHVTFLALLVPTREGLREYREYAAAVNAAIERVNARFGSPGWTPIVAVTGNNHDRALACMRRFDVLLVNPLIDGMNLVAKEGAVVNRRDGVIVLSQEAGAYQQLRRGVLGIAPKSVRATAEALYSALTMSRERRAALAAHLRDAVLREDAGGWLAAQLADLERARPTQPSRPEQPAQVSQPLIAPPADAHRAVRTVPLPPLLPRAEPGGETESAPPLLAPTP